MTNQGLDPISTEAIKQSQASVSHGIATLKSVLTTSSTLQIPLSTANSVLFCGTLDAFDGMYSGLVDEIVRLRQLVPAEAPAGEQS